MSTPTLPVRLLVSDSSLLLTRAVDELLDAVRTPGEDLDLTRLYPDDLVRSAPPDVITGSLFGGTRVTVFHDVKTLPAPLIEQLIALLDAPQPDVLVIVAALTAGKLRKLATAAKKAGARTDLALPKPWDNRGWARLVSDEFARHGRTVQPRAVTDVLDAAGLDVERIVAAVGQVTLEVPTGPITAAHTAEVLRERGNLGAFAVADAVVARDPHRALRTLQGVLDAGEDPVKVLAALTYRLRTLLVVATGASAADVGVNVSPGQVKHLTGALRSFRPGDLSGAYRALLDADRDIKTSRIPARFALEQAVAAAASPAGVLR